METICDMGLWELTRGIIWRGFVITVLPSLIIYFIFSD